MLMHMGKLGHRLGVEPLHGHVGDTATADSVLVTVGVSVTVVSGPCNRILVFTTRVEVEGG